MIKLTSLLLSLTITGTIPASPSSHPSTTRELSVAIRDSLRHRAAGGKALATPDSLRGQVISQTGTDTSEGSAPAPAAAPTSSPGPEEPDSVGEHTPAPPAPSAQPIAAGPAPDGLDQAETPDMDWSDVEEDHNPPPALPRSQMTSQNNDPRDADLYAAEAKFDLSKLRD